MHYEEIKNVKPDPRGRIGLGLDVVGDVQSFKVFKAEDGDIILRPYVEIPQKELWLLRDKKKMDEMRESFISAKKGNIKNLDESLLAEED